MNIEKLPGGGLKIELTMDEADNIASDFIRHAEDLPSAALDLSSLLREAQYAVRDHFRQPPNPWEPAEQVPPPVGKT